jgi:hypothetical protein
MFPPNRSQEDTTQPTAKAGTVAAPAVVVRAPHPSPVAAEPGGIKRWLRRFYWMDERMAVAVRHGFGPDSPGWNDFEPGLSALAAVEQLSELEEFEGGTLLLLRAAAALLGRARLARSGFEVAPAAASEAEAGQRELELGREAIRAAERLRESGAADDADAQLLDRSAVDLLLHTRRGGVVSLRESEWDQLTRLSSVSEWLAKLSDAERTLVAAALAANGGSYLAALSIDERRTAAHLLRVVTRALVAPLAADARLVPRVWLARWLRIGLSAAAVLAVLLAGFFRYVVASNLALHRPVTVSSSFSEWGASFDPKAVVDGDTSNIGFHTQRGGQQYVTIDLGVAHRIRRVVAYNRTDCCGEKAIPLRIEVSENGTAYREVALRSKPFDVWKATFSPVDARYVRLTSLSGDYFHLAEVEVY